MTVGLGPTSRAPAPLLGRAEVQEAARRGEVVLVGGGRSMAELEGPEFGKADFVLLDEVTMEHFMENLRLRYGDAGRGRMGGVRLGWVR